MPSFICCLHAEHAGNIQKAQPSAFRNSIKFLSLCSRLFLCNPIVMHWSWNQSPAVHTASVWFQTVAEHNNSIDSRINQRGKIWRKKYPGPWSSRGDQKKLGLRVRCGYELRHSQQSTEAWVKHSSLCLKIIEKIVLWTAKYTQMVIIFPVLRVQNYGQLQSAEPVCVRSEPRTAPARWGSQASTLPYMSYCWGNKGFYLHAPLTKYLPH